jgi:putative ABC transport system permease protein
VSAARLPGVRQADPLIVTPESVFARDAVKRVILISYRPGGLGQPKPSSGRGVAAPHEAVVDTLIGMKIGSTFEMSGHQFKVVGTVRGHSLLGGTPDIYLGLADAQAILFHGLPLETAVALRGQPTGPAPPGFTVMTNAAVEADLQQQMSNAIKSIDNSRTLMWVVAAVIVAALMYVSVLERVRDFAVFKAMGASSRTIFASVATEAAAIALVAAALAAAVSNTLKPIFALPVVIPGSAFVTLPISALVIGLIASLVALRRAISVDPALAFSGA